VVKIIHVSEEHAFSFSWVKMKAKYCHIPT